MITPANSSAIPNSAALASASASLGPLARVATADRQLAAEAETTLPTPPANETEASVDRDPKRTPLDRQNELTRQEQRVLERLQSRDQAVRAHEQAHVTAGTGLVEGGARLQYRIGPDGRRYAVGGEVNIDSRKVADNPQATAEKARQIQRAALAPVDPSLQDRRVAAQARAMELEARAELRAERLAAARVTRDDREQELVARRERVERSFGTEPRTPGGVINAYA